MYLALVSNYTDRPDLLIAEIERHDPGFVRRMNANAEMNAQQQRASRFRFGQFQAYVSAGLAVIAALSVLTIGGLLAWKGSAGFGSLLGLAILYAVTQGGSSGFAKVIDATSRLIQRFKDGDAEK